MPIWVICTEFRINIYYQYQNTSSSCWSFRSSIDYLSTCQHAYSCMQSYSYFMWIYVDKITRSISNSTRKTHNSFRTAVHVFQLGDTWANLAKIWKFFLHLCIYNWQRTPLSENGCQMLLGVGSCAFRFGVRSNILHMPVQFSTCFPPQTCLQFSRLHYCNAFEGKYLRSGSVLIVRAWVIRVYPCIDCTNSAMPFFMLWSLIETNGFSRPFQTNDHVFRIYPASF